MISATDTYLLLRAFVDELVRSGMRAACSSPGSRCAPLVLTLAREPRLRCYSHVDERCAGFFALGLAKASGLPVAVACTSGTAAAELLPAAIEAHEARVPLVLLTADRPPELRGIGAGQTIDQLKLFGGAAKWFFEVGTHEASATAPAPPIELTPSTGPAPPTGLTPSSGPSPTARMRWMRTLACRAYATALEGRPGVVHLNFALREPLVCDEPLPHDSTGRPDGAPYVLRTPLAAGCSPNRDAHAEAGPAGLSALRELVGAARRGVVVAGREERGEPGAGRALGEAAAVFAAAVGWPLLADPLSGARRGPAAVAHYDALLREEAFTARIDPDLVLRVGELPVSKPLRTWLAGLRDARQVALDPEGAWQDPASVLSDSLMIEPAAALGALAAEMTAQQATAGAVAAPDEAWLALWRSGDELAAEAILGVLAEDGLSEPAVAAELGVLLPEGATLFVASSMPVRDIETFWPIRADSPRVLCNRGANGIDGTVSSAFGVVADGDSPLGGAGPVVLLIGDVALAHDLGGLLAAPRLGLKLTIVLLDNGGGGIFDFLPVAAAAMAREPEPLRDFEQDVYTRHIATPTGLDFGNAAGLYGLSHERVADVSGFRAALERALARENSSIVEVRGEREANVQLHRRVWQAVSAALAPASG